MANYFIGDIQGCFTELKALLEQVSFDPTYDKLWVAGDMVARGPDSYKTLKYLMSLGSSVKAVLGNHDLHLLAIYAGIKKAKKSDKLEELLTAPDVKELTDWLASHPLLRKLPNENVYLSHAGYSPQWTIAEAEAMASLAHQKISSADRKKWLSNMYGEQPNHWDHAHTETEKFRFTINAFTRLRFCNNDGSLEFSCKQTPASAPKNLKPWYLLATNQLQKTPWIFGHWAALMGKTNQKNLYALDTGCVWGGHLTLLRWDDKRVFIEQANKNLRESNN